MMERILYGNAIAPIVIEPDKPKEKRNTAKKDPVKEESTKKVDTKKTKRKR
jgi:hypothetical protein